VPERAAIRMEEAVRNQERPRIAEAQEKLARTTELPDLQRALAQNPDADEIRKRLDGLIQPITAKAG
jgi:hypothetical protein